jgi:hypothetical protein
MQKNQRFVIAKSRSSIETNRVLVLFDSHSSAEAARKGQTNADELRVFSVEVNNHANDVSD